MNATHNRQDRLDRMTSLSLKNWQPATGPDAVSLKKDAAVEMGWGRIIFGHTFQSNNGLHDIICREGTGKRDIAFYLRDPHVLLSMGPDKLFMDPSHTYRLWFHDYRPGRKRWPTFTIRRLSMKTDAEAVNRIYRSRKMVTADTGFYLDKTASRLRTYLVAEELKSRRIIGTVTGLDHVEAFNDPESGASLWCLAVDPQAKAPGVGEALVRHLTEHYMARGRSYIDLSVMHDNAEAIALYEKLGFQRVPVFCIKRKNQINEPFFTASAPEENLNPYARIITDEARRRGISVEVLDEEHNYFKLAHGGRSMVCRESLTELTSAIAMSRCDDKRLTHRVLRTAGLEVPRQFTASVDDSEKNVAVLEKLKKVVVKPARGEQGNGISVDVRSPEALEKAVAWAGRFCLDVIIESYMPGEDLRLIVIDRQVVAAAVRRPPVIVGTGIHSISELIEKYNRRRASATDGESRIPLDDETRRCIRRAEHDLSDVIASEEKIQVRKTANLHTGGTIEDVTDMIHPTVVNAAEHAATLLNIPVTGLDMIVPDLEGSEYVIIEANERPGLANHEPQPTAERFMDLLFPQTAASA
ncbi:N-acetylglutaminylglutamine synthetase [uncultured Desulfosarcina sp.]|uniref:N-acetylglutaminylglutamine synthetase n=1 Tax=uncultured Desulfosarcina sp. TaxID=218289 RepID=UPI0029C684C4|nr:N-acetylglutaminylglutamine synthetase [uncultured Desulfosarcina sp.]